VVTAAGVEPRRAVLTADELEVLRRLAGDLRLPADFDLVDRPDGQSGEPAVDRAVAAAAAERSLTERGFLVAAEGAGGAGAVVHPSVRANLAVFAAPELLVETRLRADVDGRPHTARAAHAVAGGLGASLVRTNDVAAAELSIFSAEQLGAELLRVVPPVGRPERAEARPTGLVPLAALTQLGLADRGGPALFDEIARDLRLDAAEISRARTLLDQARGVLQVTVLAPGQPARIAQVVWYATPGGWLGLAPEPGRDGTAAARLTPVQPEQLGVWLAPLVGEAIR
jgi:hypothetical protein